MGRMTYAPSTPATRTPGRVAATVDRLLARAMRLPKARTTFTQREERVPMRDGVVLLGEHYVPTTPHPLGTVLIRTPYGRTGPLDLVTSRVLAARGYHVFVQSCRGTFGSGGTFDPMANEAADGHDTVAWLRAQEWFDGRLGTAGASYLGWTQWALMTDPPAELQAAAVLVGPSDMYRTTHGTGAFALSDFLGWADVVTHQESGGRLAQSVRAMLPNGPRKAAMAGLPLGASAETILQGRAPWYAEWVRHEERTDPYWTPRRVEQALDRATAPVLLLSGWQDLFVEQTLEHYGKLRARGVDVALTVGPWTHIGLALHGAGVVANELLAWFDEHLAGAVGRTRAPVRIHVNGAQRWQDLPDWPPPSTPHVLHARHGGALATTAPADAQPLGGFRYDPSDPTPTVGGRLLDGATAGVKDNRPLEARPDVVMFTTEPLTAPLQVIGMPVVELDHETDNPHADVFVRVLDVDPKGRSRNVSDLMRRLDPAAGTRRALQLTLDPCAHQFGAGHRIRLLVAGGSFPRYSRNTGTGDPLLTATKLVGSTHTVHSATLTLPAS